MIEEPNSLQSRSEEGISNADIWRGDDKCVRFCNDVGREMSSIQSLKSSVVRLERFPIVDGNETRYLHSHKSSEVSLERFPILSGND